MVGGHGLKMMFVEGNNTASNEENSKPTTVHVSHCNMRPPSPYLSPPPPAPPRLLFRYLLVCVYIYLFCLAGKRVNYALEHVESKFDVARTIGGALMCLTVPLATYQVGLSVAMVIGTTGHGLEI